jgi:hypothetical protein
MSNQKGNWRDYVSADTSAMFKELENRKSKEKKMKRFRFLSSIGLCTSVFLYLAYFQLVILKEAAGNTTDVLKKAFDPFNVSMLFIVIGFVILFRHYTYKTDEAKKKFDSLRSETIDRTSTGWTASAEAELRATISKEYAEKEINLIYKSK